MSARIEALLAAGVLRPLDVHFARAACRLAGTDDPLCSLGAAMASRAPGKAHVCADLASMHSTVRLEAGTVDVAWPDPDEWVAALEVSGLLAVPGRPGPLVLDGTDLYLARYWSYQQRLIAGLRGRAARRRADVDEALLADGLARLFPGEGPDLQRTAAETAVRRDLCVISGGPGTGKTTTVQRLLVLLLEQGLAVAGRVPRVALLAPTGKAAARLKEAIGEGLDDLVVSDPRVLEGMPREAWTLHRRLGFDPRRPTRFLHGPEHLLPVDVVVVDEASMVDLALMTKLFEAVPDEARLVLLGDADQLASVEAGAVLGDICHAAVEGYGPSLPATIVQLTRTWRFGPESGIGELARAINGGRSDRAMGLLTGTTSEQRVGGGRFQDVGFVPLPSADYVEIRSTLDGPVRRIVVRELSAFLTAALEARRPAEALGALSRFRVLCAHRRGQLGVAGLNQRIEGWLADAGLIQPTDGWYPGRPVLVTRNDYELRLFNGDIGYIAAGAPGGNVASSPNVASGGDEPMAVFPGAAPGEYRLIAARRLPPHETVYAMTIHKSQGSEMGHAMVVLPAEPSPIVTRELLYTGVTRARRKVTVVGREDVVRAGIAERVRRASGLRRKLIDA